jgi:hypothetical protein
MWVDQVGKLLDWVFFFLFLVDRNTDLFHVLAIFSFLVMVYEELFYGQALLLRPGT